MFHKVRQLLVLTAWLALGGLSHAAVDNNTALPALVELLRHTDDPQLQFDVLRGLNEAFRGRRQVTMPEGWEAIERKLGENAAAEVRTLAQSLSLIFGSPQALAATRKVVLDATAERAARRTALDSLIARRDSVLPDLLQRLLTDGALCGTALRGLAAFDDPRTPAAIFDIYASLSAAEKRDALNTLASRLSFAKPLIAAVVTSKVSVNDLTADVIRQLRNLQDAEIDTQIQKVWGLVRDSSADKQREIARYRNIYRSGGSQPGDGPRGRVVFARICQQCHALFDTGGKVGPDLTGSNRGDLEYVLQNMVDPNAVIPNDYRASTLTTKDDRVITGIVQKEDDKSAIILTANETVAVPRDEIKSLQPSDLSMMPEGLLAALSDQEVRDLIYYLSRPRQVPLPASVGQK